METSKKDQQYMMAKHKVAKLKKFYKAVIIYVIVNSFISAIIIVKDLNEGISLQASIQDFDTYKIWIFWGVFLVFRGLKVFGEKVFFSKDWEERKIKEYTSKQYWPTK